MTSPVRALIDTRALRHNLERVRESAPRSRVMAVIKADGYGHGMTTVADALAGADAFAVARMEEALRLREHDPGHDICLLSGFHRRDQLPMMRQHRVQPVVHCEEQLAVLEQDGGAGVEVWIKIDTGMHRLGFPPSALEGVCRHLGQRNIPVRGVMSHFANADEPQDDYTDRQFGRFVAATRDCGLPRSIANSAALLARPDTRLEWVRPGIMLYGCSPLNDRDEEALGLRPAMTLAGRVIAVRTVPRGEPVGYGSTWRAPEDTRVAIVACGYADGYPRHAPGGTPVWLAGRRGRLAGRVSMDTRAVAVDHDLTVRVGDEAELWGSHVSVTEVARLAGTISYELLCRVTARVRREVTG
jgi:alanine racemase